MAGRFLWRKFSDCDITDPFFNSLKHDYPEFPQWFARKGQAGEQALVYIDEIGIGAFIYLKKEQEDIKLEDVTLPSCDRLKIGTLKLDDRIQGQRLGEGALGVALWHWQESRCIEIYVTVFEKHALLISLLEKFGFKCAGALRATNERVYLKSRGNIDYSNPYTAFPFIRPNVERAGLLPIFDEYHDKLFPYSDLLRNKLEVEESIAGNGITKVFIAAPSTAISYIEGQPVLVYRIHNGSGPKTYKSVVTSFCVLTKVKYAKQNGRLLLGLPEFVALTRNKTVYSDQELTELYNTRKNLVILEMTYNGYFGKGHNVTHKELSNMGLFNDYPYNIIYTEKQFKDILAMGDKDVQNITIN